MKMNPKNLVRAVRWIFFAAYGALAVHTVIILKFDIHQLLVMSFVLGNGLYLLKALKNYSEGKDAWIYAAYLDAKHDESLRVMIILAVGGGVIFTCLVPIFLQIN